MSIVTESYVPKLILQLNSVQKMVSYRGIEREISQNYWTDHIGPLLYPMWDTDKDKLIQLNYYDTGAYHAKRRKFVKNHSTNEYEWKDYEMEEIDNDQAQVIFNKLKDAFYLMDSVEKESFQKEISEAHYRSKAISWFSIRLIRNFLLEDSDWVMLSDCPLPDDEKAMWVTYRQKLRDIPQTDMYSEPENVNFPISPDDWKYHYSHTKQEGETYLSTVTQYKNLSGYMINHFKERIVQYLLVKQSVNNPMNYKDYTNRMVQRTQWPQTSAEYVDELLKTVGGSGE